MKRFFLLIYGFSLALFARDYALIVGIGNYQNPYIPRLSQLNVDINNYHQILSQWKISPKYVYQLKNENATRQSILYYLSLITNNIQTGDRFLMFFSGHGTSLFDENYSQQLQRANLTEIMSESGAILPYDFNPSIQSIGATLLIGKRDLRPYIQTIDSKGVNSLIVFDACFSENSIRNPYNEYINRTPNILTENDNYPYRNITYIASSILESQSGKFSPILKKCLGESTFLDSLKICINNNIGESMQIPAVLANKNKVFLFK